MIKRVAAFAFIVCALTGCRAVDGVYSPGCMAHVGSRIHLNDSEFMWEKFTDQVSVDADGNKIDPFPGYPRRGTYQIDGHSVMLNFDDDESVEILQVHEYQDRYVLLTTPQAEALETSGQLDPCVLTRENEQ
jgi:hypothetical protein